MIVKKLKDLLSQHPDTRQVKIQYDYHINDIEDVSIVVDDDTEIISVLIKAKKKY